MLARPFHYFRLDDFHRSVIFHNQVRYDIGSHSRFDVRCQRQEKTHCCYHASEHCNS